LVKIGCKALGRRVRVDRKPHSHFDQYHPLIFSLRLDHTRIYGHCCDVRYSAGQPGKAEQCASIPTWVSCAGQSHCNPGAGARPTLNFTGDGDDACLKMTTRSVSRRQLIFECNCLILILLGLLSGTSPPRDDIAATVSDATLIAPIPGRCAVMSGSVPFFDSLSSLYSEGVAVS
jgi:hypothetical protein